MLAFVFPGQGSQKRGMGQGLFDEVPEFVAVEAQIDKLLGYSVRRLCLENEGDRLRQTEFTQPSLYVVNALYWYRALAQGLRPAFVAGHSLGEFNALLAGGVFDFLTGLRLVKIRGELMAQARGGGMAAVIGLAADKVSQILREGGHASIDVANFNSPTQTVLSGPTDALQAVAPVFEKAGAQLFIPLQVSAAFHSRYMESAAKAFASHVSAVDFATPKLPVLANVTGEPYPDTPDLMKDLLIRQITDSVRWVQCIRFLLDRGVSEFQEMGPGNVLAKLIQQTRQQR